MDIRGYDTGPIAAGAAFTSDFALPNDIPIQRLVDMVETERRTMDIRPGMRHKYMPLRFDPATGARQVGGRYLFDTWDDAVDYDRFTTELEFEPGVPFWERPFFLGVDRHVWRVAGAYDLTPLATTHFANRLERWTYSSGGKAGGGEAGRGEAGPLLEQVWPAVREDAARQGLASVWLLYQPEERQLGVVTVAARADGGGGDPDGQGPDGTGEAGADPAAAASRSVTALERTASMGRFLPAGLGAEKVFDRTSLILSMWLPRSRLAGGAPAAYPTAPVHPLPRVAEQWSAA